MADRRASGRRVALAVPAVDGRAWSFYGIQQWALLSLLAWAPLPLGSNRPWAWSLLGILIALLLFAAGAYALMRPGSRAPVKQLRWPIAMGVVLVTWILLQCLPLPGLVWHHPLWDKAAEVLGQTLVPSISVDREASLVRLFRLLTYAAFFVAAWQVGQRGERAAAMMRGIAMIGAAYAIYGLIDYAAPHQQHKILWFAKRVYVEDLTSTFINRNSFATFAGLSLIAGLVPVAELLMRKIDTRSSTTRLLSTLDNVLGRGKWTISGFLLVGAALLLSHSRGGMLATLCGVLAFVALALTAPSLRSDWRKSFGWVVGIVGFAAIALAGTGVLTRLADTGLSEDMRAQMFPTVLTAIGDNLFTGTGLGTFRYIYAMYQPATLVTDIDLAHDDYLENMLELGVPAAFLLFALVGFLAVECLLGVRRRRKDALYPCAGVAASVLVGVHSLVDFSLQIPAVAVLYATILGLGTAQALSSRRIEDR
jgi:hypothetical protein